MKNYILIILSVIFLWLGYNYYKTKADNERLQKNQKELIAINSTKFAVQDLKLAEIKDYLKYSNERLSEQLNQANIKPKQVTSITNTVYRYKDTTYNSIDFTYLLDSIRAKKPISKRFIDSTNCQTVSGFLKYDNDSLSIVFDKRELIDTTNTVAYWYRKWFLGRKHFDVKQFSKCGNSQTIRIEKSNN